MKYEDKFSPETASSVLNSFVRFCDVIIAGKETAVALKYDEENMFAPMIVLIERDLSAETLVCAAGDLGVPVIKNVILTKNLVSHGKAGETIPEASYRDVSLALARLDSTRFHKSSRGFGKSRQGVPVKIPRPLSLELGESLFALTSETPEIAGAAVPGEAEVSGGEFGQEKLLAEPLDAIRKKLMRLLGISLPAFRVSRSSKLKGDEYRILFKGLEAGRGRLELGWYSMLRTEGNALAQIKSVDSSNNVIPDMMNEPENIRIAARVVSSALLRHAREVIQTRAPELLGRDEVEAILDAAEEKYPVVTGEVKSLLSLGVIREILQSLVSEQVSIRHIAVILETLADWGSFGPAPSDLIIERIRQSLKRQICLEYADDRMTLRVLTLEQKLEKKFTDSKNLLADRLPDSSSAEDFADSRLRNEGQRTEGLRTEGSLLAEHISFAVKGMEEKGFPPVILCSPKARSPVKEATRRRFPELAVLSYLEIPSDINVVPLGEIRLEGNVRLPGLVNEQ